MNRQIFSIALNTFRESIRSKILYSIFLFAFFIMIVSSLFGAVTIGDKVKVLKDFGLFSVNIFAVAYIVITGSSLLFKELSKKTILNILSKPVQRKTFLYAKFWGVLITVTLLLLMMFGFFLLFIYFYEGRFDPLMLQGLYSILLQIAIVCALVIFFSAILVTPFLSGALSFIIFLVGRSSDYLLEMISQFELTGWTETLFSVLYYAIPHLDKLDICNNLVYGQGGSVWYFIWSLVYTATYCFLLLLLAGFFFRKREFK